MNAKRTKDETMTTTCRKIEAYAKSIGLTDIGRVTLESYPTGRGTRQGYTAWGQNLGFTFAQAKADLDATVAAREANS